MTPPPKGQKSTPGSTGGSQPTARVCKGCGKEFPSRNAVFKHLKETDAICLFDESSIGINANATGGGDVDGSTAGGSSNPDAENEQTKAYKEEYEEFVRLVHKSTPAGKVAILFGYLPFNHDVSGNTGSANSYDLTIHNGQDAARILLHAIDDVQSEVDGDNSKNTEKNSQMKFSDHGTNRSYGNYSRKAECLRQDDDTACITEVMTTRIPSLRRGMTEEIWLQRVQDILETMFRTTEDPSTSSSSTSYSYPCAPIRVLGRQDIHAKFDPETDMTQRRVEYLLPIEFLTWSLTKDSNELDLKKKLETEMPAFSENHRHTLLPGQSPGPNLPKIDPFVTNQQPQEMIRVYLLSVKSKMKLLTTQVVDLDIRDQESVQNKQFNIQRRSQDRKKRLKKQEKKERRVDGPTTVDITTNLETKASKTVETDREDQRNQDSVTHSSSDTTVAVTSNSTANEGEKRTRRVLKRRRYHNFTERLLAHDFLAYRRLDRFYHRATWKSKQDSTFAVISMSGDLILNGQASRLIGLVLAFANGIIDPEFADVVFDENYLHLVPTPPALPRGVISAEALYSNAEGKNKCILSARVSDRYDKGWNKISTIQRVKEWQSVVYDYVASQWRTQERDASDRLVVEREWTETVLLPWAEKAKQHLIEYKHLKSNTNGSSNEVPRSLPDSEHKVPEAYKDVLFHLRQIDVGGKWPTTTPKRQMVMVSNSLPSTNDDGVEIEVKPDSLSIAFAKAKNNQHETRSSAYSFKEGCGGASGSFSVGYMPGGINKAPKSNELFPEFVKSAFELERVLFPNREPSSTIAVNRNAQFRPHTDSGAGVGQSTSLIVALGNFHGGELVVEGDIVSIQYNPIEFDGWKQRHWTMPFEGERYSLVWFTPKGCEGLRGIDLDL